MFSKSAPSVIMSSDLGFYYDYLIDSSNIETASAIDDTVDFIKPVTLMYDLVLSKIDIITFRYGSQSVDKKSFIPDFLYQLMRSDFFDQIDKDKILLNFLVKLKSVNNDHAKVAYLYKQYFNLLNAGSINSSIRFNIMFDCFQSFISYSNHLYVDISDVSSPILTLLQSVGGSVDRRSQDDLLINNETQIIFILTLMQFVYHDLKSTKTIAECVRSFLCDYFVAQPQLGESISYNNKRANIFKANLIATLQCFFFSETHQLFSLQNLTAISLFCDDLQVRFNSLLSPESNSVSTIAISSVSSSSLGVPVSRALAVSQNPQVTLSDWQIQYSDALKTLFSSLSRLHNQDEKYCSFIYFVSKTNFFDFILTNINFSASILTDSQVSSFLYSTSQRLPFLFYTSSARLFLSLAGSHSNKAELFNTLSICFDDYLEGITDQDYQHYDAFFVNLLLQFTTLNHAVISDYFTHSGLSSNSFYIALVPYIMYLSHVSDQLDKINHSEHNLIRNGRLDSLLGYLKTSCTFISKLIFSYFNYNESELYAFLLREPSFSKYDKSLVRSFTQRMNTLDITDHAILQINSKLDNMRIIYSFYSDLSFSPGIVTINKVSVQRFCQICNTPGLPESYYFSHHAVSFIYSLSLFLTQALTRDTLSEFEQSCLGTLNNIIRIYHFLMQQHYSINHHFLLPCKLSLNFYNMLLSAPFMAQSQLIEIKPIFKSLLYYLYFSSSSTFSDSLANHLPNDEFKKVIASLLSVVCDPISLNDLMKVMHRLVAPEKFISHHLDINLDHNDSGSEQSRGIDSQRLFPLDEVQLMPNSYYECREVVTYSTPGLDFTLSNQRLRS